MEKFIRVLVALTALLSFAVADIDLKNVNQNNIQELLPSEFANPNEALNQAKAMVKDKCVKVAGEEAGTKAFDEIEKAAMNLGECATNLLNFTVVQKEIELASPKGELDEVFSKYCNKRPEAVKCIEDFNAKLAPCLDEDERGYQTVFMRIVNGLLNFICHKDGDHIALFVAEMGPECLQSKKDEIQQCLNGTFAHYMPKDGFKNLNSLPKFVMEEKQCDDMQKLETCIVKALETCNETTPANVVEAMFRFIKKETSCFKKE